MPNTKNQSFRIKIIDELLGRKKWVKTADIQRAIELKFGEKVAIRTIQQDIYDMKNDTRLGYYAPIEYKHYEKAYAYSDQDYSISTFSLRPQEIDALQFYAECLQVFSGYRLFDSFTSGIRKVIDGVKVRNKLRPGTNARTIIQTDSLVTPAGQELMEDLVYAIDNRYKIKIDYQAYEAEKPEKRILLPVFLKEYRNRWYLLAFKLDKNEIRTYSLDRMSSLEVTDEQVLTDYKFNPQDYFEHSFGITTPDAPIETIVLRFSKQESPYIISLPIHPTQQVIRQTGKTATISIRVILSYEVYDYILSKGPGVKVLSPDHVAKAIAEKAGQTKALYFKK